MLVGNKMKKQRIKYISIKLPACSVAYPLDEIGNRNLPNYTPSYLKNNAKKLVEILINKVPSTIYSEVITLIKDDIIKRNLQ